MTYLFHLGLFLPLVGFLILMSTSNIIGRVLTGIIACSTVLISFICFATMVVLYLQSGGEAVQITLFKWIPIAGIDADFLFHIDSLSLLMTLIITGVGFLIHLYSNGYMEHDPDFARFFACMNFFIFAMLTLVLAGHLVVLFFGWEGVGVASYLLIGFWYQKKEAGPAATKAFVINRVGDLGFLLGLLLTFQLFGTGDIMEILKRANSEFPVGTPIITVLTLLYFVGAVGKSAQLPLYTWLPDAMAGPTPVSALIHAATMVTAGVYLMVRMHDVFMLAPFTMQVVGTIGGITALFAAICSVGQTDIKRVLAYSTVSQLGFMVLACGAGAFYAAMFHLTMHAFMKALLFLSIGSLVHMLDDVTEMKTMGAMKKRFPITQWEFLIGALALSGIPPFAAFFSKDLIIDQEFYTGFYTLYVIALLASAMTGVYMARGYYLTFAGESRMDPEEFNKVQEAPKIMWGPVTILALLSMVGGLLGFGFGYVPPLERFLGDVVGVNAVERDLTTAFALTPQLWAAVIGAFGGFGGSLLLFMKFKTKTLTVMRRTFFVDEIYDYVFVLPLKKLGQLIANFFETEIFMGSIQALGRSAQGIAGRLQQVQSGQIRSYIAWMILGTAICVGYFAF